MCMSFKYSHTAQPAYRQTADGNGWMLPFYYFFIFLMNHHMTVHSFTKAGAYRPKAPKQTYDRKQSQNAHTDRRRRPHRRVALRANTRGAEHTDTHCIMYTARHAGPHRSQPCMSNRQQQLVSNHYSMVRLSGPRTNERRGEADGPQMIPIMTVALINQ
jgi:hypothetical protein